MLPCRLDPDLHYFGGHENMNYRTPSEAAKVDSPGKEWAQVVREGGGAAEATPNRRPVPQQRSNPG